MIQPLPVTAMAALILGAWIALLTWRVIALRRTGGVVHGDADDRALQKAIRGQANATEQIPIFLILLGLAEAGGIPVALLAPTAAVFVAGRLVHGAYFGWDGFHWRLRVAGMLGTLAGQGVALTLLAATLVL